MDIFESKEEKKFGSTTYRPRNFMISFIWLYLILGLFSSIFFAFVFPALWRLLFQTSETYWESFSDVIPFSLLFGVFVSLWLSFLWKARFILVTFQNRQAFLSELNAILNKWNYNLPPLTKMRSQLPTPQKEKGFRIYRHAGIDPSIWVQMEDRSAKIIGPSSIIKKLQKRLGIKADIVVKKPSDS